MRWRASVNNVVKLEVIPNRLNGNTTVVRYLEDTWAVVESCLKLWEILPKHPKTAQIAKGVAYDIFLANLAQIIN